uniref:ATP synthase F0 subunit 8 n=1 Tax=Mesabolivar sp. ITV1036I2 TaxID=2508675 RepID=A0A411FEQ9_9ARAC|nr:ATP synthase F0 subunit 8 [Mesabolivar sp. ITV1036I2]
MSPVLWNFFVVSSIFIFMSLVFICGWSKSFMSGGGMESLEVSKLLW